ncbi:3-isopropylmalate dehydratase small subunit [Streptomyces sp. NPDC050617]|uniref:LeuD/DmdB family oxidoreductase small subunit n=1 Tax=Streptomyces sp. NPDC050617 TaxID=3154628 RepID=UPI00341D4E69
MGKIWKFGDDVDTDQIIATRYLLLPGVDDMKGHTFEGLRPEFAGGFTPGDIIVAGKNFGCGSSREQAPRVIKALGAAAVIAPTFARIFYRNSINIGLPVVMSAEASAAAVEGEEIEVDLEQGTITTAGSGFAFPRYPDHVLDIVRAGGLIEHLLATT